MFQPTDDELRTKTRFWTRAKGLDLPSDSISALKAIEVTGDTRLAAWWGKDGFQQWFQNNDDVEAELEFLAQKLPAYIRDILEYVPGEEESAQLGSKVAALRLLSDLTGRTAKTQPQTSGHATKFDKMSSQELKDYIKKHGMTLVKELSDGQAG